MSERWRSIRECSSLLSIVKHVLQYPLPTSSCICCLLDSLKHRLCRFKQVKDGLLSAVSEMQYCAREMRKIVDSLWTMNLNEVSSRLQEMAMFLEENTMYIGELGGVTDADWALDNGGYLRWFNVIYADWALDNGGYLRWFNVIYGDNMNHVGGCRVLLSETSLCD
uniref:Uncharacterized protein n=4 Tax=Zea mays TaxID=4577 RepID=A0A804Q2F5_MAIZE